MSQQLKEKKDLENQPPSKVAKSALVTMIGGGEKKGGGNQKEIQPPEEKSSEYMTEEDLGDFFEEESGNGFGEGIYLLVYRDKKLCF